MPGRVSMAPAHPTEAELGAVTFETSCKPQVAADINRGVALLHSFWHEEARRTFERAAAADADCAMAWWGPGAGAVPSVFRYAHGSGARRGAEGARDGRKLPRETSAREAAYIRALHPLFDGYKPRRTTSTRNGSRTR